MKRKHWPAAFAAALACAAPLVAQEGLPLPESDYTVETDPVTGEKRLRKKTPIVVDVVAKAPDPIPLLPVQIQGLTEEDLRQLGAALAAPTPPAADTWSDEGWGEWGEEWSSGAAQRELQRLASVAPAATDRFGIAGSYTVQRGGSQPFKVTVAARQDGAYDVTRESGLYRTGVGRWNADDTRLEVEFPRVRSGGAQGALLGEAPAEVESDRVRYRIQPVTGRIEGDGAKGWRDGSITPLTGYYVLSGWQARSVVELWVAEAGDGTLAVRRVTRPAREGAVGALVHTGVAEVKGKNGRTLAVKFGGNAPEVEYRIREDGRIEGNYFARTIRGFEGRYEEGWRNGVEQPHLPGLLARSWKSLKRFVTK